MSLLVLDEHVSVPAVAKALAKHFSVVRLPDLRPGEMVLDDRAPEILVGLDRPTFVTIDADYWKRALCHRAYCILLFALSDEEQYQIPELLRELMHHPEFKTRAARMGKVARITHEEIEFWQFGSQEKRRVEWSR